MKSKNKGRLLTIIGGLCLGVGIGRESFVFLGASIFLLIIGYDHLVIQPRWERENIYNEVVGKGL